MTPPSLGTVDLCARWGISSTAVYDLLKDWETTAGVGSPPPPPVHKLNKRVRYVTESDLLAWEAAMLAAGRALPGSAGPGVRGPDRRQRKLRGGVQDQPDA